MRAVVLTAYGSADTLRLQELPRPVPKPGELLVRVHATTVTAGDAEIRGLRLPWLFRIALPDRTAAPRAQESAVILGDRWGVRNCAERRLAENRKTFLSFLLAGEE